jgi:anti-sigma B factor antagonist
LEWHVIIRQLNRVTVDAAAQPDRASGAAGQDGGSDVAVMTAERAHGPKGPRRPKVSKRAKVPKEPKGSEPQQLELSRRVDGDGNQIVSMAGELDIATAEQAYIYISDVIDAWPAPVSVDLSGLTFCDASGLGVLARTARHARQAGRQLRLTAARPSLLKIMRITGLDRAFPELVPSAA